MVRLNTRQIVVFDAVMRVGNASAAAEMLHVGQPAISKTLTLMEEEVGYQLFRRTGRGMEPTPQAEALWPHVQRVRAEMERLQGNAAVIGRGLSGIVTIGSNFTLISALATKAATQLRKDYPEIGLRLSTTAPNSIIEDVIARKIDIGMVYGPIFDSRLHVEQLCSWPCVCVFPAGHRFGGHSAVTAADLLAEPILTYPSDSPTGRVVGEFFAATNHQLAPVITFGNTYTLLDMVRRGLGLGIVDTYQHFSRDFPELGSVTLMPTILLSAMLVTAERPASGSAIDIVRRTLMDTGRLVDHGSRNRDALDA